MKALLTATDLRKLFPVSHDQNLYAVDDVSFSVMPGQSLGLVGESGSGKSTIARLVSGLAIPDSGSVALAGMGDDVPTVQLVFQSAEDALNPAFTIERNISVGLGRSKGKQPDRIRKVARSVDLPLELMSRKPHQLSGGQQARAGIARALIAEPELLVLDEPTAALDVSVQASVLKLIDALRREHDIALLFISHDLEVVRLMCDTVMVLYLGRVAEYGPVKNIMSAPKHPYSRALLAATPGKSSDAPLQGDPLSPINPPDNACLFHNRCPLAIERCRNQRPALLSAGSGWQVACHRADEPGVNALVEC